MDRKADAEFHQLDTGHRARRDSVASWTMSSCNDCDWFAWRWHPEQRAAAVVDMFLWDAALERQAAP